MAYRLNVALFNYPTPYSPTDHEPGNLKTLDGLQAGILGFENLVLRALYPKP